MNDNVRTNWLKLEQTSIRIKLILNVAIVGYSKQPKIARIIQVEQSVEQIRKSLLFFFHHFSFLNAAIVCAVDLFSILFHFMVEIHHKASFFFLLSSPRSKVTIYFRWPTNKEVIRFEQQLVPQLDDN